MGHIYTYVGWEASACRISVYTPVNVGKQRCSAVCYNSSMKMLSVGRMKNNDYHNHFVTKLNDLYKIKNEIL